jgi:hypothetical protein
MPTSSNFFREASAGLARVPVDVPAMLALLRRQAGVVSRAQALRAGLTAVQIDRLVARRRWTPLHPRVYLVAPHEPTDEARLRGAVLWAGDGAVPRGRTALWWHGLLPTPPGLIILTVAQRCPDPRPGIRVHRRPLPAADLVSVRGLTVPVLPLALLDSAVEDGPAVLRRLHAHVTPAELHAVVGRALGPASAEQLLATMLTDVSCTPRRPRAEWLTSRNRYS